MSRLLFRLLGRGIVIIFLAVVSFAFLALIAGHATILSAGMIAFSTDQRGNWDIALMDIGHNLIRILTYDRGDHLGPVWSFDRQQLAFYADKDGNGQPEVYIMGLMDTDTASGGQMVTSGMSGDWSPTWSPDGKNMAIDHDFSYVQIIGTSAEERRELIGGFGPAWSPLGGQIAFYVNQGGGNQNFDVFVIATDSSYLSNLTRDPSSDWDPAWSPDGRQIVFASSRDGSPELYIADAICPSHCGTNIRRLTYNHLLAHSPSWSPDGQQILFRSEFQRNF